MASWTDGAAYAPIERPDGFATPETAPLPVAEPAQRLTPGAVEPPSGFAPMPPSVALDALGKKQTPRRDPAAPFNVSSALMTAYTAGHETRNPNQPFAVATIGGPSPSPAPPDPASRLTASPSPQQPVNPQYTQTGPIPLTQAQRTLLCVAGIAAVLGVFVPAALPWLLIAGGALLLRAGKAGRQIGIASLIVGALLALTLFARMQVVLNGLGRWIGLIFGIACLATAFSSAQR